MFLVNSVNLRKEELRSSDAAFQLIDDIEKHVVDTKESQFNDLRLLSQLSQETFGDDRTKKLYDDNVFIYQSFEKVKSDIVEIVRDLKVKEDSVRLSKSTEIEKIVLDIQSIESVQTSEVFVHEIVPVVENVLPKFTLYLESAEVQEGEDFLFECNVVGLPHPETKWLKYNSQIIESSNVKIHEDSGKCSLEISNVSDCDAAVYSCVATNVAGTSQTTANLIVKELPPQISFQPPSFTKYLQNGYANEKSTFEFNCVVSGLPLPTVQWFKNGICVDNHPNYNITFNNGSSSLSIQEVDMSDQGVFSVRATNQAGSVECSGILSVEGERSDQQLRTPVESFTLH